MIVNSNASGEGALESIYSLICLRVLTKLPDPPKKDEDMTVQVELVQK